MSFDEAYGDLNLLRIEDLGDRREWKIVTYRDPCDGRKTRTHSALRRAIDNALPVTKLPKLLSVIIDYVWIKGIDENHHSKGEERPIDDIVTLLRKKGFNKDTIKKVDKNLARTFNDYKKRF